MIKSNQCRFRTEDMKETCCAKVIEDPPFCVDISIKRRGAPNFRLVIPLFFNKIESVESGWDIP